MSFNNDDVFWALSIYVNVHPFYTQNNNTLTFCVYFVIIYFWFDCCSFDFHSYFSYSDFLAILQLSTSWRLELLAMILDDEWLLMPALKASTQLAHELLFNDVRSVSIILIFFLWNIFMNIMLKHIVALRQCSV